jgi:hypothetical protein
MARSSKIPSVQPCTMAQQIGSMSTGHPQLRTKLKRNKVIWGGPWCPSALSENYTIRVTYEFRQRPRIAILNPTLRLAFGCEKLPHTYPDGQYDICVHLPEEWNSRLLIVNTIMPWISQWLRFYEYWVQTGSWEGGGEHPEFKSHRAKQID